jgi:hypothetical protein
LGFTVTGHRRPQRDARDAAALAAAVTRRWVDGYTGWVGTEAAERRRDEIASDVWEQRAEATARGVPSAAVALSIAGRVIAGIPADLSWVHAQRLAMRNQPASRKVLTMNTLGHIAARWWWVIGAATLAVVGTIALFSGGPDLARVQVLVIVALLVIGVALRHALPRAAGTLVVVGAAVPAVLIWAPWLMVIGIATLLGAAVEVVRLTEGVARRMLAAIGLAALAGSWLWVGGLGGAGTGPTDPALWGPIVLGVVGVALVVVTGTRHRPVAAA